MEKRTWVWQVDERQKLVSFLQQKSGGSGKGIRRQIERNGCKVNGRFERFGSRWVEAGDRVEYFLSEEKKGQFETLFENEYLRIVNKPAGWTCSETQCRASLGNEVFLVHRLDRNTTGALLLAKSVKVRDELMELFATRTVEKEYLALVDGLPREGGGTIQTHLAKKGSFHGQTIWGSSPRGDLAITHWSVAARGKSASLLLCRPETGRTHQIRVHLAEMGHPILVDRQYAERFRTPLFAARPLLHASHLKFAYRGETIESSAPTPFDFKEASQAVGIERYE